MTPSESLTLLTRLTRAMTHARLAWAAARQVGALESVGDVEMFVAYNALREMRRPSDAMVDAGDIRKFGNGPLVVTAIWEAMIDAALREFEAALREVDP